MKWSHWRREWIGNKINDQVYCYHGKIHTSNVMNPFEQMNTSLEIFNWSWVILCPTSYTYVVCHLFFLIFFCFFIVYIQRKKEDRKQGPGVSLERKFWDVVILHTFENATFLHKFAVSKLPPILHIDFYTKILFCRASLACFCKLNVYFLQVLFVQV